VAVQKQSAKKPSAGAEAKINTQSEEVKAVVEETPKVVEAETKSPLDEVMLQAEKAYAAYMDAERQVAKAYHENALTKALQNREAAVKRADEAFKSAEELARAAYEAAVQEVQKKREENIEKAWKIRDQTIEQAWQIYSKIAK
jgi:hypothetical protein